MSGQTSPQLAMWLVFECVLSRIHLARGAYHLIYSRGAGGVVSGCEVTAFFPAQFVVWALSSAPCGWEGVEVMSMTSQAAEAGGTLLILDVPLGLRELYWVAVGV